MKRIMSSILIFLLMLTGIFFAVLNSQTVQLNYYFGVKELALSLLMILNIIIGTILGILVSAGHLLKARHDISRLKKNIQLAEKEVSNLRTIPIKDSH
ncbi:MAG: LapA family protein [Gammaproteobacteria bacterium]|nr:LapA family protein [Gammaproteobacteria bacterium]